MFDLFKKIFSALLLLFFTLAILGVSDSGTLNISSTLNKNKVKMGENFVFTISISGNYNATPEIKLPDLSDFIIVSSQQSSSYTYNIKARKNEAVTTYYFSLLPKRAGILSIDSVEIRFDHRTYKTPPLTIEVLSSPEFKKTPLPEEKELPWRSKKGFII